MLEKIEGKDIQIVASKFQNCHQTIKVHYLKH